MDEGGNGIAKPGARTSRPQRSGVLARSPNGRRPRTADDCGRSTRSTKRSNP